MKARLVIMNWIITMVKGEKDEMIKVTGIRIVMSIAPNDNVGRKTVKRHAEEAADGHLGR